MALYLFAFIGIIAHYGLLLDSARRKPDFSLELFLLNNLAMFIMSFIVSGIIVYQYYLATESFNAIIRTFLGDYVGFMAVIMFLVGYNSGDIWHRINKLFRKNTLKDQPKDEDED